MIINIAPFNRVILLFYFFFLSISLLYPAAAAEKDIEQDGRLKFLVIGDWGTPNSKGQRAVVYQMNKLAEHNQIDFIATTGDNFYMRGVKSVEDPLRKSVFEEIYSLPGLKNIPWCVSLGNHDHLGNIKAQMEYGQINPNWILPAGYHQAEVQLSKERRVQLLFLDTCVCVEEYRANPGNCKNIAYVSREEQTRWIEEKLSGWDALWRIAFAHYPVYSAGAHGDTEELKPVLPPIFAKYKVQAYFAGHDHHLEHSKPAGDTHHFISGGGSRTRRVAHKPETEFALQSLGFAHVIIQNQCMRVRFIDEAGRELYGRALSAKRGEECQLSN